MPHRPVRTAALPARYRQGAAKKNSPSSPSSSMAAGINGSVAYQEKLKLLTYNMALAQPGTTAPLLAGSQPLSSVPLSQRLSSFSLSPATASQGESVQQVARRWVRDSDELCVASIRRSTNINRINTYVATYKFHDPQWKPFLLPEVHVLPSAAAAPSASSAASPASPASPPPPPPSSPSSTSASSPFEVYVDYNKMNTIELVSRHANYALRHLVQKGHAMYFVNYAQHSLLEMRGLVESSHITCAYGIRGERLRTHMIHIGPLDVRDVIEVDPATRRVSFNLDKKGVRKGVVAVSQVEGYGTWFQRKPMLWQRTRRIGALQSQLGAFGYELCAPEDVGRVRDYEVSLLAPHLRVFGSSGSEAVGLIASSQVAQNDRLYMGEFEAPVLAALDAVQQLAHATARHHQLVQPPPPLSPAATDVRLDEAELAELRQRLAAERLLPVSWVTRTPPPYVPLEGDLPFKLQMSKPSVFATQTTGQAGAAFPTGGTVGAPFVRGVPLSLIEYNLHQGVDHYIFDDAPSARPMKWWNQKSNMPYNGYLYAMRSGLLDYVVPAERIPNPLAPPTTAAAARATSPHRRTTSATQRLKRLRKRRQHHQTTRPADSAESAVPSATAIDEASATGESASPLLVSTAAEQWDPEADGQQTDLVGHTSAMRQEEADLAAPAEADEARVQYRAAVHRLVPPSPRAARRATRYHKHAGIAEVDADTMASASAEATARPSGKTAQGEDTPPPQDSTKGLNKVLRKKLRRLHAAEAKKKKKKRDQDGSSSSP